MICIPICCLIFRVKRGAQYSTSALSAHVNIIRLSKQTTKPIDVCEGFPPTKRQQDDTVDIDIINAVPPTAKRQGGTTSIEKPFNDGESDPKLYCIML
jgi:hypothetical protein